MDDLIIVRQIPIIEERLLTLKDHWDQQALDAEAMICTPDTIQTIKGFRADMRKEFEDVDAQRKAVKKAVMGPYEQFETIYKDCVTTAFQRADRICADKISETETEIKRLCEDGLRDYFYELCAVRHLDWLEYERAGIKVDMASAKAKAPKKLREQLADFVTRVGDAVNRITPMDDAEEIMIEFRETLDAGKAICTVQDRHRRIEEERAAREARYAALEQEAETVRKVEALAPPVVVEAPKPVAPAQKDPNEIIPKCAFVAYDAPRWLLWEVKQLFERNGIRYGKP